MASKGFHKDMDVYLERRSSDQPRVRNKKKKSQGSVMDWFKNIVHRFTDFFASVDNINLNSLNTDVVVIKHSSSPASMFVKKMKQIFGKKKRKTVTITEEKPEDEDIDPALIEKTLKNNRL